MACTQGILGQELVATGLDQLVKMRPRVALLVLASEIH